MGLSPSARRRSLKIKLGHIKRKIVRTQEHIYQLEQESPDHPDLFGDRQPALRGLKEHLKHLEGLAQNLRKELAQSAQVE
jgi:hypothetical protein